MASRRAVSRTSWTNAVISGAWAAASSLGPDHVDGAAGADERVGVEPGLLGVGEGAVGDVGVGEAADGVAEGLPDPGPGLLDHGLGLLQGAADRGELGMVAEDVGGFGVGVVLAPGRRTPGSTRRTGRRRAGRRSARRRRGVRRTRWFPAPSDWLSPVVARSRAWARRFAALTVRAVLDRGFQRTRRGQLAAPVRSSTCTGDPRAFPGGGGEEEQVELGGGDQQPAGGVRGPCGSGPSASCRTAAGRSPRSRSPTAATGPVR